MFPTLKLRCHPPMWHLHLPCSVIDCSSTLPLLPSCAWDTIQLRKLTAACTKPVSIKLLTWNCNHMDNQSMNQLHYIALRMYKQLLQLNHRHLGVKGLFGDISIVKVSLLLPSWYILATVKRTKEITCFGNSIFLTAP